MLLARMKSSGEQIDDRIVEVHWDPVASHWRMMRFRDDKPHGNYRTVVDNIIQSIADGVEKDAVSYLDTCPATICLRSIQLLERSAAIRNAWKARHAPPQRALDTAMRALSNGPSAVHLPPPDVRLRYGPLAASRWSRVSGPEMFAGMCR
jgi:mRNA guanylyltransferase